MFLACIKGIFFLRWIARVQLMAVTELEDAFLAKKTQGRWRCLRRCARFERDPVSFVLRKSTVLHRHVAGRPGVTVVYKRRSAWRRAAFKLANRY
jgi:hypothetical protein